MCSFDELQATFNYYETEFGTNVGGVTVLGRPVLGKDSRVFGLEFAEIGFEFKPCKTATLLKLNPQSLPICSPFSNRSRFLDSTSFWKKALFFGLYRGLVNSTISVNYSLVINHRNEKVNYTK
jgi:hypothetical protein